MAADDEVRDHSRNVTRRDLLRTAGFTAGGLAVGAAAGVGISQAVTGSTAEPPDRDTGEAPAQALTYFNRAQATLVAAITARIFPSDEDGPGAPEAGVVYYIDQQLAGDWGAGAGWYLQGPFRQGEPTQGWQYDLTPRQVYTRSLQYLEQYCDAHHGKSFTDLPEGTQDEVLQALSDGGVEEFRGLDSADFFDMVRENTLEGMYSDPAHGGNAGMVGWRLKEYPGHAMSYLQHIESTEFVKLEPRSLATESRAGGTLLPTPHGPHGQP